MLGRTAPVLRVPADDIPGRNGKSGDLAARDVCTAVSSIVADIDAAQLSWSGITWLG